MEAEVSHTTRVRMLRATPEPSTESVTVSSWLKMPIVDTSYSTRLHVASLDSSQNNYLSHIKLSRAVITPSTGHLTLKINEHIFPLQMPELYYY